MHVNDLLPSLSLRKKTLSLRQARRWLWCLGYRRKRHSKGVYWDGHERKDVRKRRTEYLAELAEIEALCGTFDGPEMEETLPTLSADQKEHVIVVHDECAFHTNDFSGNYWLRDGEQVLKKKDKGRLVMVSGFICQRYGNLALTEEMLAANKAMPEGLRLEVTDSRVVICPTSRQGGDNYWNMDQMIAQVSVLQFGPRDDI